MILSLIKSKAFVIIGLIIGFFSGLLYWKFYGCAESCAIWSVWWRSALYGCILAGLLFSAIQDYMKNGKF